MKGLRQKGLDYLLEADELYEYDGGTQTLRQNGLTLVGALQLDPGVLQLTPRLLSSVETNM